jgi:hypothetical protein
VLAASSDWVSLEAVVAALEGRTASYAKRGLESLWFHGLVHERNDHREYRIGSVLFHEWYLQQRPPTSPQKAEALLATSTPLCAPKPRAWDPLVSELRAAYAAGRLVVFAGGGVSATAGLPTWKGLAELMLARLRSSRAPQGALEEIVELMQKARYAEALFAAKFAFGDAEFSAMVEESLEDRGREIPAVARAIAALRPKLRAVVTTSMDRLLDRAFEGEWAVLTRAPGDLAQRREYILKLYGTLIERDTWVFAGGVSDYAHLGSTAGDVAFKALFDTHTILFIGCDLEDDLHPRLERACVGSGQQRPVHFVLVAKGIAPFRRRRLEDAGLRLVEYDKDIGEIATILAALR